MTVVPLHVLHGGPTARHTTTPNEVATAHFGELRDPLLGFIAGSQVLVGCIAWVTDRDLLDALSRHAVALVVQKENWWKKADARGQALARRYAALHGGIPASAFPDPLGTKTFRGKPVPDETPLAPIACVGYGSGGQHQPLMHHKFLVRCVVDADGRLVPTAVWTGSFNFSGNASKSFENAVEIHEPTIARAYLEEFALVASVSEPMNWRLARPNPKGLGTVFVAPPVPPKATTARVVKGAGRRRAAAKKSTGTRPAARKAAPAAKKSATVTPIRTTKKTAPPRRRRAS